MQRIRFIEALFCSAAALRQRFTAPSRPLPYFHRGRLAANERRGWRGRPRRETTRPRETAFSPLSVSTYGSMRRNDGSAESNRGRLREGTKKRTTPAFVMDVEFIKTRGQQFARSVAIFPIFSPSSSSSSSLSSAPLSSSSSSLPFLTHFDFPRGRLLTLSTDVVMKEAEALPAGHVLLPLLESTLVNEERLKAIKEKYQNETYRAMNAWKNENREKRSAAAAAVSSLSSPFGKKDAQESRRGGPRSTTTAMQETNELDVTAPSSTTSADGSSSSSSSLPISPSPPPSTRPTSSSFNLTSEVIAALQQMVLQKPSSSSSASSPTLRPTSEGKREKKNEKESPEDVKVDHTGKEKEGREEEGEEEEADLFSWRSSPASSSASSSFYPYSTSQRQAYRLHQLRCSIPTHFETLDPYSLPNRAHFSRETMGAIFDEEPHSPPFQEAAENILRVLRPFGKGRGPRKSFSFLLEYLPHMLQEVLHASFRSSAEWWDFLGTLQQAARDEVERANGLYRDRGTRATTGGMGGQATPQGSGGDGGAPGRVGEPLVPCVPPCPSSATEAEQWPATDTPVQKREEEEEEEKVGQPEDGLGVAPMQVDAMLHHRMPPPATGSLSHDDGTSAASFPPIPYMECTSLEALSLALSQTWATFLHPPSPSSSPLPNFGGDDVNQTLDVSDTNNDVALAAPPPRPFSIFSFSPHRGPAGVPKFYAYGSVDNAVVKRTLALCCAVGGQGVDTPPEKNTTTVQETTSTPAKQEALPSTPPSTCEGRTTPVDPQDGAKRGLGGHMEPTERKTAVVPIPHGSSSSSSSAEWPTGGDVTHEEKCHTSPPSPAVHPTWEAICTLPPLPQDRLFSVSQVHLIDITSHAMYAAAGFLTPSRKKIALAEALKKAAAQDATAAALLAHARPHDPVWDAQALACVVVACGVVTPM